MLVGASVLAGLAGCHQSPSAQRADLFGDYLKRLERVFDQTAGEGAARETRRVPVYPDHRARSVPVADLRIGVLDALALRPCLGPLIGQRNSILGRVMAPSQQLIYEARFVAAARACRDAAQAAGDDELVAQLNAVLPVKRQALQAAIWNAAFDSKAVAAWLSLARLRADADIGADHARRLAALLAQARDGMPPTSDAVESALAGLSARAAGDRLHAAAQAVDTLGRGTALIDARMAKRPLCFRGQPGRAGKVAQTVAATQFAGRIQPELATISRDLDAANTALAELLAVTSGSETTIPTAQRQVVRAYLRAVAEQADWLRRSARVHARAWQRVLVQCGLAPGGQ